MDLKTEEKIAWIEAMIFDYEQYQKERKELIKKIIESESSEATSLEELLIELKFKMYD